MEARVCRAPSLVSTALSLCKNRWIHRGPPSAPLLSQNCKNSTQNAQNLAIFELENQKNMARRHSLLLRPLPVCEEVPPPNPFHFLFYNSVTGNKLSDSLRQSRTNTYSSLSSHFTCASLSSSSILSSSIVCLLVRSRLKHSF